MEIRMILFLSLYSWTRADKTQLSMWIDETLIREFFGVSMEIFIIEEGEVIPLLKNPKLLTEIPPIPSEVNRIRLTWQAGPNTYWYYFAELKSLDKMMLYDPLLSIPSTGVITHKQTTFEVAVPCTDRRTGIARLSIALHIQDKYGKSVHGSPLNLTMRKECYADSKNEKRHVDKKYASNSQCDDKCRNEGECNEHGDCECKPLFAGRYCEIETSKKQSECEPKCENNAVCASGKCVCEPDYQGPTCQYKMFNCEPVCSHGGLCIKDNQCQCRRGYRGKACQIPLCRRDCGNHGKCVSADRCKCDQGWYGRNCNKHHKEAPVRIRRRKLRRSKRQRHRNREKMRNKV